MFAEQISAVLDESVSVFSKADSVDSNEKSVKMQEYLRKFESRMHRHCFNTALGRLAMACENGVNDNTVDTAAIMDIFTELTSDGNEYILTPTVFELTLKGLMNAREKMHSEMSLAKSRYY